MTIKHLGGIFGRNPTFNNVTVDGGIYFESGSSQNLLDDYEEGIWTPTITGATSGTATLSAITTSYTKVGSVVSVSCYLAAADVTGLSGAVRVGGLPFVVNGYTPVTITFCDLFNFDESTTSVSGFTDSGNSFVNLYLGSSKTAVQSTNATATSGTMMFTVVYNTTA